MTTRLTPPMLQGTPQQQIFALRDWMFQRVKELDAVQKAAETEEVTVVRDSQGRNVISKGNTSDALSNVSNLKALIQKTANEIISYADSKLEEFNSLYVAKSEYGTFTETITSQIETTARGVSNNYKYIEAVESALQKFYEELSGSIVYGIVLDPEYDGTESHPTQYVVGIAISQSLTLGDVVGEDDENYQDDGHTYYYIGEQQTFGLYTSTGWQFWINGQKKGWFRSTDGILHVANVKVDNKFQMGNWSFQQSGDTFGIIYVGD